MFLNVAGLPLPGTLGAWMEPVWGKANPTQLTVLISGSHNIIDKDINAFLHCRVSYPFWTWDPQQLEWQWAIDRSDCIFLFLTLIR